MYWQAHMQLGKDCKSENVYHWLKLVEQQQPAMHGGICSGLHNKMEQLQTVHYPKLDHMTIHRLTRKKLEAPENGTHSSPDILEGSFAILVIIEHVKGLNSMFCIQKMLQIFC